MNHFPKAGRSFLTILTFALALSLIGFIACGGGNSQSEGPSKAEPSQKAGTASAEDKAPSGSAESQTPEGWQATRYEEWSLAFPGDWNVDPDTEIWQPGEVGPFRGRPPVSVHMGGIPVMPPADFEGRIKSFTNAELQDTVEVKVGGFPGVKGYWEEGTRKHVGLFLKEDVAGGMIVIHFFDCQAPAAEYDTYAADFEKILAGVHK